MKQARAGSRLREWQDREVSLRHIVKFWQRAVERDAKELEKTTANFAEAEKRLSEHLATAPTVDDKGKVKWPNS